MKTQSSNAEKTIEKSSPERWRTIGEYIGGFFIALLVALVKIFDVIHPTAEWPWFHRVAEMEPTVLAAMLLLYVVFERFKVLNPTKKKVDAIEVTCTKLDTIANASELSDLLDATTAKVVEQLSSRVTLKINESAEATYKHILRVLESVEHAKSHNVKTIRHGIFHAEGARNATPEDDQPYFEAFRNKMKEASASSGGNRWNVNVLYNVTHTDRLNVILTERLILGTVGYNVRAMCLRDFSPVFSPLVIDGEHVFIAVFGEGKNRVSRSVYMHGENAARFFADYFDILWADWRVKILREEGVDNEQGIAAVKAAVIGARQA